MTNDESLSKRAAGMQNPLRLDIGGVGLFGCIEVPDVDVFHADLQLRSEATTAAGRRSDTEQPCAIADVRTPQVLRIDAGSCIAQVREDVVEPIAVQMVDVPTRPFTRDIEPCQAARLVEATIDGYPQMAMLDMADRHSNLHAPAALAILKFARLRVIRDQLSQASSSQFQPG